MDMVYFAKRLIVLNGDLQILASLLMFNWLNCEPTGERVRNPLGFRPRDFVITVLIASFQMDFLSLQ